MGTQNILELNPEIVSANDELTCTVTIVDAYLDETISQATAIIQNKPPENISIAIADANDINNTSDFYVATALDCIVGFDDLDRDDVFLTLGAKMMGHYWAKNKPCNYHPTPYPKRISSIVRLPSTME